MTPLLRVMDHPRPLDQVKVAILDDPNINAASAGGGEFQVTTGLLQKANDVQLAGVLAHELAHDDLGHVAKAQTLDLAAFIEVHDPHVIVYDRPRPYENHWNFLDVADLPLRRCSLMRTARGAELPTAQVGHVMPPAS